MSLDRQDRMRGVLDALRASRNIIGATLITRDGLLVMNSKDSVIAPETFSAMTAALMGAAETAFYDIGGATKLRVTAEGDNAKLVALGVSPELLLVLIGNKASDGADLLRQASAAVAELARMMNGGPR